MGYPPPRHAHAEYSPAGCDDGPDRLFVLRLGNDTRAGQPADEQQQSRYALQPSEHAQPRPVRQPAAAARRLLLGTSGGYGRPCGRTHGRLRQQDDAVSQSRDGQVRAARGIPRLPLSVRVRALVPAHVEPQPQGGLRARLGRVAGYSREGRERPHDIFAGRAYVRGQGLRGQDAGLRADAP